MTLSDEVPAVDTLPQRKCLVLQPRPVHVEWISHTTESESGHSEDEASFEMTDEAAMKKIGEDLKEFFAIRNLEEAVLLPQSTSAIYFLNIITSRSTSTCRLPLNLRKMMPSL